MKLSDWFICSVLFVYCVWRSEDNFWGAIFSFHHVGPSQAYDTRRGCKHPYLLSQPETGSQGPQAALKLATTSRMPLTSGPSAL